MSDFLLTLGQGGGAADLAKMAQSIYPGRHPESRRFEFPWGSLAVLEERFGNNIYHANGAVVAWVGDLLTTTSEKFFEDLLSFTKDVRNRPGTGEGSKLSHATLDLLNGSFAFMIADARGFSVITDLMNYVQVYMASDEQGHILSVGTHPDLVASVGGQAAKLDLTSVGEFLNAGTPLFPNTVYSNVKELSPGSIYSVAVSNQGQRTNRGIYWVPPYEVRTGYDEGVLAEELRNVLLSIVRSRCEVGKAGVFLSGGLDSRLIMAAVPESVECVGLTFSNNANRETRTAKRVAACYNREWLLLSREQEYLADCLVDAVKLTGCEYEWTCAQVIGVAKQVESLNLDVILEGTLFNDYFTAFCAREWQLEKRWGGLLPSQYRTIPWNYLDQIAGFCRRNLSGKILGLMQQRRQKTYHTLADPKRGSPAEWMEIYPFSQDPSVGYYPAERRTLPIRLAAMDRRALDFSFRCPIELKLGGRLYRQVARTIYGNGNRIPNANDGVRPDSGHWSRLIQRGVHELKRKGNKFIGQLRGRAEIPHSWHDYQRYWRESAKLRQLCHEYGPNLDEFDGLLIEGRGRDLLASTDLHWEFGFRLLQLAVWRKLTRRYTLSDSGGQPLRRCSPDRMHTPSPNEHRNPVH
jgi:asparagine synthase (glutamine-hydrolysing)